MKRIYIYLLITISSLAMSDYTPAQSFYDINTIQKIEIVFSQNNWDYMLDTAKAKSDGYIMAKSVTINGVQYDSVGVKYKGNSTYSANQIKNPLHIELDTYKEQDYEGYKDIKLSNVAKDPSFVREVLSYSILRKYMIASQSNYANVYVNGTLMGLYVNCESVGKTFVNKNFYSKTNSFFKCNPIDGATPQTTDLPNLVYLGTDSTSYMKAYEIESDYGWKDLINLCSTLKNNIGDIENILDVDKALWMLAFDNVLVNLDSYIGQFSQNYYLYKDGTGRFNSILWDFNESFGTFSQSGTINLNSTSSKSQMTHLLHSGDANWPLVQKLLSVPTYKRMYLAHMQTILSENFTNGSYLTEAKSYLPIINASVQADQNKFFTYAQYQSNLTSDVNSGFGPGASTVPGISNLMNARNTYLSSQSDFTYTRPAISTVSSSSESPLVNSEIFITAKVTNTNANSVWLGYRFSDAKKFTKVLMYDDGAHGDGASGDNTYGAAINVSGITIQYYIYAENSNAGIFSPVRAEHEFYTINANSASGSNISMNEIYSRGTTSDPDWIEIYNSTSSEIDISGYKIYDSGGESGSKPKKEFPSGSVIPSNGFIVILTDESSTSGFGLSSAGEKVWLEDASGSVIDTVSFPVLTASESYGRIPDGGAWQILSTISQGISNISVTGIKEISASVIDFQLNQNYPNPFNPTTTISYTIPIQGNVSLKIYDVLGKEIITLVDEMKTAGNYQVTFNATQLVSGMYFYKLETNNYSQTKKMILLK